jgi:hypothetical protein
MLAMITRSCAAAAILCATVAATTPGPTVPATMALLHRATNPNPALKSYTASAQLSALLHVLVPVHRTFNGTVYYLRPARKIEFQGVPGELSRFRDLTSSTPTYEQAVAQYAITPLTDNGKVSTYSLVPRNTGSRVKNVVLTIGDHTALVHSATWHYTNGGTLTFSEKYMNVGEFRVPAKANIAARFPGYSVDGDLTFTNYQPNAPVSPEVFASPTASP